MSVSCVMRKEGHHARVESVISRGQSSRCFATQARTGVKASNSVKIFCFSPCVVFETSPQRDAKPFRFKVLKDHGHKHVLKRRKTLFVQYIHGETCATTVCANGKNKSRMAIYRKKLLMGST